MRRAILILAAGLPLAHAPAARAANFVWNVEVWNGTYNSGVTDQAALGGTAGQSNAIVTQDLTPTATFTYDGPIAFANNAHYASYPSTSGAAVNTPAQFGMVAGDIGSFTSAAGLSVSQFLNDIMLSTPGETGNATNTYMILTTQYSALSNGLIQVWHDDGASAYVGSSNNAVFTSAAPTADIPSQGVLPAAANQTLTLVYDEANGAPSDLSVTITGATPVSTVTTTAAAVPAPEPAGLAVLASGMLALAMIRRRHRRRD